MLLKMAWRNMWRNKRRSLITCFSVGFGFFLALSLTGMGEDSYARTVDTGAKMGMGHVTVLPEGYMDKPGLDRTISNVGEVLAMMRAAPEVEFATVRIQGMAMFAVGGRTRGGAFLGIDPATESPEINPFIEHIVEGELFADSEAKHAVLGRKMAERLGVKIGKKVVFTTTDAKGEIISDVVRVSGLFETGVDDVDGAMVLLPLGKVRSALHYGPQEATFVAAVLRDQIDSDAVAARLAMKIDSPGASVETWEKTQPELVGLLLVDRASNRLFQFLIGLLIAAGVLNTIYMSVLERKREFGVLMAVGMSPWSLFRVVMAESIFIAVVGMLLGGVMTVPWYIYMTEVGIDMSAMVGEGYDIGGIAVDPVMRILLRWGTIAGISGVLLVLTIVAGMFPAWVAGRTPPVESLRVV